MAEYIPIETLSDKEFYKLVNIGTLTRPVQKGIYPLHEFLALDGKYRVITMEPNTERAYFKSVALGCDTPWVLNALYFKKEFFENHNNQLKKALSS